MTPIKLMDSCRRIGWAWFPFIQKLSPVTYGLSTLMTVAVCSTVILANFTWLHNLTKFFAS